MNGQRKAAIPRRRGALALTLAMVFTWPAFADDLAQAREHFKKGQARYAQGDFTGAAQEFREAYRLRDEPALLFNIAQAYRRAGHAREAYSYYSRFLARRPEAPNRADVEGFLDLLRHKLDAADRADAAAAPVPPPAVVVPSTPPTTPGAATAGKGDASAAASPVGPPAGTAAEAAPASNASPSGSAPPAPAGPASPPAAPGTDAGGRQAAESGSSSSGQLSAAAPAAGTTPEKLADASSPAATRAPTEAIQAAAAPPAPNRTLRYAGLAAAGVGIGAEVLAYVFHASAQSSANELARRYQAGTLQASDASLSSDVQSKGRLSTLTAVGGLILLAAGSAAVFAF